MKGDYHSLIRLARWTLDERRREQAVAYQVLEEAEKRLCALDRQVVAEQQAAQQSLAGLQAFGPFAGAVRDRRAGLIEEQTKAQEQVDVVTDQVRAAFEELKRYEKLQEARDKQTRQAYDRREQILLDEMAQTAAQRRG